MARDGLLSKVGLALGCLVAVVLIFIVAWGWFDRGKLPSAATARTASAARSPAGWEIRYNATLALARRGSDLVKGRLDVLAEMLDEDRQRQNFRAVAKEGTEQASEVEAAQAVNSALKAVAELHRRQPGMDLSPLYPVIDRLAESGTSALRAEAQNTKKVLNIP